MAFDTFYRHPRMDFFSCWMDFLSVAVDALRLHGFLRLSFISLSNQYCTSVLYVTRRGGFFLKNYTWGYVHMSPVAHWGRKTVSDPLECSSRWLWTAVWVLGTSLRSSARAVHAVNL